MENPKRIQRRRVKTEDVESLADQAIIDDGQIVSPVYGYTDSQVAFHRGFVKGYNKAKENIDSQTLTPNQIKP